MMDYGRLQGF
jgi:hypothetical protein